MKPISLRVYKEEGSSRSQGSKCRYKTKKEAGNTDIKAGTYLLYIST